MKKVLLILVAIVLLISCNLGRKRTETHVQKEIYTPSTNFFIESFTRNEFVLETFGKSNPEPFQEIMYYATGVITNNTNKNITNASLIAVASIFFENKTINLTYNNEAYEFVEEISPQNAWRPNEERHFQFKLGGIEPVYLEYTPEEVLINFSIIAEDPVGNEYNEIVNVYDIISKWKALNE